MNRYCIAAVSLVLSSSALASINPGSDAATGGELILSVWDDTSQTSYTLDLGIDSRSFNPDQNQTFDLSADQAWNTFTSGASTNDIVWNIVASDRDIDPFFSDNGLSSDGLTFTGAAGSESLVLETGISILNTLQTNTENYVSILNNTDFNHAENLSYFRSDSDYAGNYYVQPIISNLQFINGSYGESLSFWHVGTAQDPDIVWLRHAVHMKDSGTWTLAGNTLTYETGSFGFQMIEPFVVPVPAALWLFASSLAGLGTIFRLRK